MKFNKFIQFCMEKRTRERENHMCLLRKNKKQQKKKQIEMWELRELKITQASKYIEEPPLTDNLHDAQFITHFTIENVLWPGAAVRGCNSMI